MLLKQLCVVDVDDLKIADELEKRFPYLKQVPTEQTIKGRHYWFIRSPLADAECFYDGAAQVIDRVDFKSVSAEGTSGFVVVAPSYGKTWTRPISRAHYAPCTDMMDPVLAKRAIVMAPIPDDLLRAVARSRMEPTVPHTVHDDWNVYIEHVLLTFTDKGRIKLSDMKSPRTLQKMTYFDIMPLLDSSSITSELHMDVPCNMPEFQAICDFCVHKELIHVTSQMSDIITVADRLGLRMDIFKKLCHDVTQLRDVGCVCPDMLTAIMHERRGRRNSLAYPLTDVFCIAPFTTEDNLCANDNGEHVWLFDGLNVPVLRICPNLRLIPKDVDLILSSYPGKLVLAGGSALSIAVDGVGKGSDYDMFLVDVDEAEASMILHSIETSFNEEPGCTVLLTRHALTIVFDDNREPIQIILRLHTCVAGVLLGFDISASRVGVGYDSIGVLRMWCTHSWVVCVHHRMFVLESAFWGRGSILRVIKYIGKGFNCMVPVGRTYLMRKVDPHNMMKGGMEYNSMMQYGRLSGLFAAVKFLSVRRLRNANVSSYINNNNPIPWWWSLVGCGDAANSVSSLWGSLHAPLSYEECRLIAFSVSIHSDYDMASKATRKLKYVVRGIRRVMSRLGVSLGYLHENRYKGIDALRMCGGGSGDGDDASGMRKYTFVKPSIMGMFYPMDICFDEVYDLDGK